MTTTVRPPAGIATREPWFRRRPSFALAVAVALFVVVLTLRLLVGSPVDAYSMFYAVPVALVATTFGLRGGALAGMVAVALIALWVVLDDVPLTASGWASRILPLLLLGGLIGHATDRMRRAENDRLRLEEAAMLHRQAIEINDSLVQGMAAAKWSLDSGQVETGKEILDQTISEGHRLVSGLIRRAGMGGHSESLPGDVPRS